MNHAKESKMSSSKTNKYREMISESKAAAKAAAKRPAKPTAEALEAKQAAREAYLARKAQGYRDVIRASEKEQANYRAASRSSKQVSED